VDANEHESGALGGDPSRNGVSAGDTVEVVYRTEELPGMSDSVLAVPLGHGRYRLLETPILSAAYSFGDVVDADLLEDGTLVLRSILEPSGVRTWRWWSAPRSIVESQQFADFVDAVANAGGVCQVDTGFPQRIEVSLPPGGDFDPEPALEDVFAAANAGELQPSMRSSANWRATSVEVDLNLYR
jgi:hypothetical protein